MMRHRAFLSLAVRDLVPSPDPLSRVANHDVEHDAHRRAQAHLRRRFRSFRGEVPLAATLIVSGHEILVQGRLDGFWRTRGGVALCEIKPVQGSAKEWLGRPELRGARRQLLLYADLAARVSSPPWGKTPITDLALLLVGSDGKVLREHLSPHIAEGALERRLIVFLSSHTAALEKRREPRSLDAFVGRDARNDRPVQTTAFEMLARAQGARLLLSIPPGTGKTRVAVRHALRISFQHDLPLLWITTKARGREVVLEELERYRCNGVPLRIVWKTAAARTCTCPRADASCPLRIATEETLFWNGLPRELTADSWSPDEVLNLASRANLCPHELSRQAESSADVIVADVNYLIAPSSLHRERAVVVVDEAQNLSKRTRERFEATLSLDDLRALARRLSPPEKHELQRLLPAHHGADEHELDPSDWLQLFETAHLHGLLEESHRKFLAVLRLWKRFPADVVFAWYHGGATPLLLGAPLHLERILDSALTPFPFVLALSGSLPGDVRIRESLFPGASRFECVEVNSPQPPNVFLIPLLDFKHPLSVQDHEAATELLQRVFASLRGTVLVFGQNRASNEILAARLRVRGLTCLLDEDVREDWTTLRAARPDFLFVALGGSLSESVNPPPDVFSCAVVLSAGFPAPDPFAQLRELHRRQEVHEETADALFAPDGIAEAASRIVQAVGRVQRDPNRMKPAFLAARCFASEAFLQAWPQAWRSAGDRDFLCRDIAEALAKAVRTNHAS